MANRNNFLFVLLFQLLLCLTGCIDSMNKSERTKDRLQVKTADMRIKNRFMKIKTMADSIARIVTGIDKLGDLYCKYQFEYYDEQKYNNDSLVRSPMIYHIDYCLLYEGDTIGHSGIAIDSTYKLVYCRIDELIGQKEFLDGNLSITKTKALKIASQNGVNLSSIHAKPNVEFYTDSGDSYNSNAQTINNLRVMIHLIRRENRKFYWSVENHCDGCTKLKINAANSVISEKQQMRFIY